MTSLATVTPRVPAQDDGLNRVIHRVAQLRQLHAYRDREKELIRAVCSGPDEGLRTLLGDIGDVSPWTIPAANLVLSGLTRLSQKLGRAPDRRVDPPAGDDKRTARKKAETRARFLTATDEWDNQDALLNLTGMWVPGYAFAAWVVKDTRNDENTPYGGALALDPYGTYPATALPGRQPKDIAYVYRTTIADLVARYPHHRTALIGQRQPGGGILLDPHDWPTYGGGSATFGQVGQGHSGSVEVVEYYDVDDCWVILPEKKLVLERYTNPIDEPQFHVFEKVSFSRPVGQYDHTLGLQAQIASFNSLAAIALREAVHTETNVIGDIVSGQYRKGLRAVNYFTPGTQISKPVTNLPYQLFQELDRLERQFRTTAGYAVTDDAIAPAAQATGQGIERLNAGIELEVKQYLGGFARGLEAIDRKKLKWEERSFGDMRRSVSGVRGGEPFAETYVPTQVIGGHYRTRRTYGAMAGLDDSQKIVGLLQLLQGKLIDKRSAMEELDLGGRSVDQIVRRIKEADSDEVVWETLRARAAEGDAAAMLAAVEIRGGADPDEVLRRFYTPAEPELSPEEEAFLAPQPSVPAGPPPLPQDVMAMLAAGGPPGGPPALPAGEVAA